jgi:colanic acid/amylovoran biosynthesis glycosyltransferase
MKTNVAHLIRKSTQVRASFIFNQIIFHKKYSPVLVYTVESNKEDGGYANYNTSNHPSFFSGINRNFFSRLLFHYTWQITKKESNDIINFLELQRVSLLHLHYGSDAGIFWRVMKNSGIPSIVSFYGYDCSSFPSKYKGLGKFFLQNFVFKYATKIVAMSSEMKKDLQAIGCPANKIIVHYYGTDTQKFYQAPKPFQTTGKITILTSGRLDEKKGHLFLLRVFRELKKHSTIDLKWIIAGDGMMRSEILHEISNSALQDSIKMVGSFSYNSDTLKDLLSNADIYVQPSVTAKDGDKEGIPGTLIEAMAAGLPVISTYHAGIPEVIENGVTGLLVHEWNHQELLNAILILINDGDLRQRLGNNAQKFACESLDIRIKENNLENLYDSIISSIPAEA